MPTSRQRRVQKARGVKPMQLPSRGQQDKPGHLVTKREAVTMAMNMLNNFILSPSFATAVQNVVQYGCVIPPTPAEIRAAQVADQEDRRTPEDFERANKVLDMLQPDRPPLVVVP